MLTGFLIGSIDGGGVAGAAAGGAGCTGAGAGAGAVTADAGTDGGVTGWAGFESTYPVYLLSVKFFNKLR